MSLGWGCLATTASSSRFLLPSNGCLPRDRGGTGWGGTSWFPIGVEIVPGICSYLRSSSYLPPAWVAVNILHQCFYLDACCEPRPPPLLLRLGAQ